MIEISAFNIVVGLIRVRAAFRESDTGPLTLSGYDKVMM
jgi:hypothetical protein